MRTVKFLVLTMAISILMATTTVAATIEIYNTGFDSSGSVLVSGGTDGNYRITGFVPDPTSMSFTTPAPAYTLNSASFPIGYWFADSGTSRWITPNGNNTGGINAINVPSGYYTYRTTFDLTGLDPTTAVIQGKWSTDNEGWAILMNDSSTGFMITNPSAFGVWNNFLLNSGFTSGVNTLDFVVKNDIQATGNPSGLRVEITSATAAPVPEPGTMMLLGSGLVGLAGWGRKKFRK